MAAESPGAESYAPSSRRRLSKAAIVVGRGLGRHKGNRFGTAPSIPCDLIGSVYELLGFDPDGKLPNSQGLDVRMTPTLATASKMAGPPLKEIM